MGFVQRYASLFWIVLSVLLIESEQRQDDVVSHYKDLLRVDWHKVVGNDGQEFADPDETMNALLDKLLSEGLVFGLDEFLEGLVLGKINGVNYTFEGVGGYLDGKDTRLLEETVLLEGYYGLDCLELPNCVLVGFGLGDLGRPVELL